MIELQNSQKLHNKVIQKQLQMSVIKKYLKIDMKEKIDLKDLYLQKKKQKIIMIRDKYNNKIME